jgi:hypothetical protein
MQVPGYDDSRTFLIDQNTVLGNDQLFQATYNAPLTDPKRDGVCSGLSIVWIARRIMWHKESPKERLKQLGSTGGYRFAGRTQDIPALHSGSEATRYETYLKMYGPSLRPFALKFTRGRFVTINYETDYVDDEIVPEVDRFQKYHLFNFQVGPANNRGWHTVACYSSMGKWNSSQGNFYLFDPNMGEYKIKSDGTAEFLTAFFDEYVKVFGGVRLIDCFEVGR